MENAPRSTDQYGMGDSSDETEKMNESFDLKKHLLRKENDITDVIKRMNKSSTTKQGITFKRSGVPMLFKRPTHVSGNLHLKPDLAIVTKREGLGEGVELP
jgi:hypothetical protein